MLEQLLRQLKGDGRDMTTEHLANLSKNLAGFLPQGPVRRGIVAASVSYGPANYLGSQRCQKAKPGTMQ